jgi:hypothetical protein
VVWYCVAAEEFGAARAGRHTGGWRSSARATRRASRREDVRGNGQAEELGDGGVRRGDEQGVEGVARGGSLTASSRGRRR